jgi:stearoyl-CoA desaturase (delta-9 desaturase)
MYTDPRPLQGLYALASLFVLLTSFSFSWLLISLIVYAFLVIFGVNLGLHRGLAHGVVPSNSWIFNLGVVAGALTNLGSPLNWAVVHRLHHRYSDTELDPHGPVQIGKMHVFFNLWRLPQAIPSREKLKFSRDLMKVSVVRFCHKNFSYMHLIVVAALGLSVGFTHLVYLYLLPCSLCLFGTSLVNAFCHGADGVKDVWLINFLTMGEGMHKTHHRRPSTLDYSFHYYFDPTGKIISLLLRLTAKGGKVQHELL